jgi:SAM-dependent methyltransferase
MHSDKTAIKRNKQSTPLRKLLHADLIRGRVLDYGSGFGFDANSICAEAYDPSHGPANFPEGQFDTILCTYVLNVLPDARACGKVLKSINKLLKVKGLAFVTVRRDIQRARLGFKGWQRPVYLRGEVSLWRTSGYEVYVIGKKRDGVKFHVFGNDRP